MAQFPTIIEQKGKHDYGADEVLKGLLIGRFLTKKINKDTTTIRGVTGTTNMPGFKSIIFFMVN
ncbi:hypothetical protein [Spirosoma luteum]|uniref:hypothetical protein n=1 Tax=Spirosoma luteum TaxID=431553 RepID=UPI000361CD6C|nr:hypothetical protein [Spirosoma luteum]